MEKAPSDAQVLHASGWPEIYRQTGHPDLATFEDSQEPGFPRRLPNPDNFELPVQEGQFSLLAWPQQRERNFPESPLLVMRLAYNKAGSPGLHSPRQIARPLWSNTNLKANIHAGEKKVF